MLEWRKPNTLFSMEFFFFCLSLWACTAQQQKQMFSAWKTAEGQRAKTVQLIWILRVKKKVEIKINSNKDENVNAQIVRSFRSVSFHRFIDLFSSRFMKSSTECEFFLPLFVINLKKNPIENEAMVRGYTPKLKCVCVLCGLNSFPSRMFSIEKLTLIVIDSNRFLRMDPERIANGSYAIAPTISMKQKINYEKNTRKNQSVNNVRAKSIDWSLLTVNFRFHQKTCCVCVFFVCWFERNRKENTRRTNSQTNRARQRNERSNINFDWIVSLRRQQMTTKSCRLTWFVHDLSTIWSFWV